MPDPARTVRRGFLRHRAVFVSSEDGLTKYAESAEARRLADLRIREYSEARNAYSFLIVDCRLLEPANPVIKLLPRGLRARMASLDRTPAGVDSGLRLSPHPISGTWLRGALSWLAAACTAAAGFWIFFQRAA